MGVRHREGGDARLADEGAADRVDGADEGVLRQGQDVPRPHEGSLHVRGPRARAAGPRAALRRQRLRAVPVLRADQQQEGGLLDPRAAEDILAC